MEWNIETMERNIDRKRNFKKYFFKKILINKAFILKIKNRLNGR